MKPDEKQIQQAIVKLFKTSMSDLSFYKGSQKVEICELKNVQVRQLEEVEYGNYNYQVYGVANIGISVKTDEDNCDCLTEHRTFKLIVQVEEDEVIAVKENRIELSMKIFHYTSLDAAVKILTEVDKIRFMGTRFDSMNDPTDCEYAKNVVLPRIQKTIDEMDDLSEQDKEEGEVFPYIVSFSYKEDDFNMWRMYNAEVALEFDYDVIKEIIEKDRSDQFIFFEKCKYPENEDAIHTEFLSTLRTLNQGQGFRMAANQALAFIKRPEFRNENEIRLVAYDNDGSVFSSGCFIDCEIPQNIGVKMVRNGDLVLYKEFLLPKIALTGIILNCNSEEHYKMLKSHLQLYLHNKNYSTTIEIRKTQTGNLIK